MEWRYCEHERETFEWGVRLGRLATKNLVVALNGDLGAGKTVFARGVGEGLGVRTQVQSPSYAIIQSHEGGRLPFWHADLYRIAEVSELEYLGLDECLEGDGLLLVEWCSRAPALFQGAQLHVFLEDWRSGRRLRFVANDRSAESLIEQLCER